MDNIVINVVEAPINVTVEVTETPVVVTVIVSPLTGLAEYATKSSAIDPGYQGQQAYDDDYEYRCTIAGVAGSAIWKKKPLFKAE